jgi:hypothetical protein
MPKAAASTAAAATANTGTPLGFLRFAPASAAAAQ